jgi:hypothetical protein
MKENRLMQQVGTIFGAFMTLFYFGVGIYLIQSHKISDQDRLLRMIVGSTFIIYGIYRAYRTYVKVVELFFSGNDEEN